MLIKSTFLCAGYVKRCDTVQFMSNCQVKSWNYINLSNGNLPDKQYREAGLS